MNTLLFRLLLFFIFIHSLLSYCDFNPPHLSSDNINFNLNLPCQNLDSNSTQKCIQPPYKTEKYVNDFNIPLNYIAYLSNLAFYQFENMMNLVDDKSTNHTSIFGRPFCDQRTLWKYEGDDELDDYYQYLQKQNGIENSKNVRGYGFINQTQLHEEIGWGRTQLLTVLACAHYEKVWNFLPFTMSAEDNAMYLVSRLLNQTIQQNPSEYANNIFESFMTFVDWAGSRNKNNKPSFQDKVDIANQMLINNQNSNCEDSCECSSDRPLCGTNTTCDMNASTNFDQCVNNCLLSNSYAQKLTDIQKVAISWYGGNGFSMNKVLGRLHSKEVLTKSYIFDMLLVLPETIELINALLSMPRYNGWSQSFQSDHDFYSKYNVGDVLFNDGMLSTSANLNSPTPKSGGYIHYICETSKVNLYLHSTEGSIISGAVFGSSQQEVLFRPNIPLQVVKIQKDNTNALCVYLADFDYNKYWEKYYELKKQN